MTRLTSYENTASQLGADSELLVPPTDLALLQPLLEKSGEVTQLFWAPAMQSRIERVWAALMRADGCSYRELNTQLRALREVMEDELRVC